MTYAGTGAPDGSALEPLACRLEYRVELSGSDRAAVLALPHTIKAMKPQQYMVREGDRPTHCCLIVRGFAIRQKIVGGGQRQILSIHMNGEAVDLQNSLLNRADHSVQMLTAGVVAMIPRTAIEQLTSERPAIARAMWIDTLVDASIFREWLANVGRRDARTRIAHLLCEFSLRLELAGLGEKAGYELPMSQEELGDATGLTAVHINRTIKALEAEGLIERATPRTIVIGDWRKLAQAGDFDSGYLHRNGKQPAMA